MHESIDLIGKQFAHLKVKGKTRSDSGRLLWVCICSCGCETLATASELNRGNKVSCGCHRFKDISGQVFGYLTAVKRTDKKYGASSIWECKCTCGNTVLVPINRLASGNTKSCGCLNRNSIARTQAIGKYNVEGTRIVNISNTDRLPSNNTSGVRGVSWRKKSRKWEAYIKFQGKTIKLGFFDDLDAAAKARKEAEEIYYTRVIQDWKMKQENH